MLADPHFSLIQSDIRGAPQASPWAQATDRQQKTGDLSPVENGARCRVRTCDPIRVKDVLYH